MSAGLRALVLLHGRLVAEAEQGKLVAQRLKRTGDERAEAEAVEAALATVQADALAELLVQQGVNHDPRQLSLISLGDAE